MEEIRVSLPDGTERTVPRGTPVLEVARSIGSRLAREALAAKVNDRVVDLDAPLTQDSALVILTPSQPETLEVYRHSTAHLLAQAVQEIFPDARVGIGPVIDGGFYYDFEKERPFTPEDLQRIESKMKEIVQRDLPIHRREIPKEEAIRYFQSKGESLKVELIREKGGDPVSCYQQGEWLDFCRGPHLPSTGRIKAFKLLSIAGAYWKGSEENQMLQRIYGTAFFRDADLQEHLRRLEEAKKRDHRKLGPALDLFSVEEVAGPGLIFWHPKGTQVRQVIEDFWKVEHRRRGYELVTTPHIARDELWNRSGHLSFYRENMYTFPIEEEGYVLKPMNCPGHSLIYKSRLHSYRDLPIRLAELGTVYRYERSGVLHGMMRVRGFTQDDAHIFCTPEQAPQEVLGALDLCLYMLRTFGYGEFEVDLSLRDPAQPEKYAGDSAGWDMAEKALVWALEQRGLAYRRMLGEAVFYGPKIDIRMLDALGRAWQGPTVQFDFNLPGRLDIHYLNSESKEVPVVMIHRAVLGSLERFFGSLVEHYAGAFPFWLAPVQAVVLPITDRVLDAARAIRDRLRDAGIRAESDPRNEKIGAKIRDAEMQKVPYMLIIGDKEAAAGNVSVRIRSRGDQGARAIDSVLGEMLELSTTRALAP
ncbi:MAG TPA: threonine--tRNA ligase [Candidatus Polarisedimenticolia bacterium]|jgi:threonyl-tRNA synthetase|nr:threonine--tRNA ligase [Candidatus Polarisedimenticolia bacterium]